MTTMKRGDIAARPWRLTRGMGLDRPRGVAAFSCACKDELSVLLRIECADRLWRDYTGAESRESLEVSGWLHTRCLASLAAAGSVMQLRWEGPFERL